MEVTELRRSRPSPELAPSAPQARALVLADTTGVLEEPPKLAPVASAMVKRQRQSLSHKLDRYGGGGRSPEAVVTPPVTGEGSGPLSDGELLQTT
ncbi:hypothetical protein E2562_009973 [Oryza meyeriana var. granulata]|uniref:Uncharacterized protein n=1 Tax=Oryza meyeriana var. granulata TaxID=110450 RepID=A0A6G1EI49_9ORYZ|nr:hypothetical protein E2562_009973 [Oryza meyeriana var. granulata]